VSLFRSTTALALSSVTMMLCQTFTIHLYARRLPEAELADYLVAMSVSLIFAPFLSLGVNDGVLYFAGRARNDREECLRVVATALAFLMCLGAIALAAVALGAEGFSHAFFAEGGRGALVWIAVFLALSRFTYDTFFRYLTARGRALQPALLQLFIMGVLPMAVVVVGYPLRVEWLLFETALLTFVFWIAFFLVEAAAARPYPRFPLDMAVLRQLVGYGVQRVPAILGLILLLSSPVVIARKLELPDADVVIVGAVMALLRMMGITNQLITYVIMPRIAWAKDNAPDLLASIMWILISVALITGMAVAAGLVATGDAVLGIWLHRPSAGIGDTSLSFWFAALPFIVIYFLRPTIDALHFRAYNTVNVFAAVCVMAAVAGVAHAGFDSPYAIGYGVLAAGVALCGLSLRTVWQLTTDMHVPSLRLGSAPLQAMVVSTALLAALAWTVRGWEASHGGIYSYLAIGVMGLACGGYLALGLLSLRAPWRAVNAARAEKRARLEEAVAL